MGTTIMLLMTREYSVHGGANGPTVDCKGVVVSVPATAATAASPSSHFPPSHLDMSRSK